MPRNPICRLGEYLIDPTSLNSGEQGGETRTLFLTRASRTTDRPIGMDADNLPAFLRGTGAQKGNLILDRPSVLELATVAGVEEGSHQADPWQLWPCPALPLHVQALWRVQSGHGTKS